MGQKSMANRLCVESVAPIDAKRPYSTLMFSRKERKGRKERTPTVDHDCLRYRYGLRYARFIRIYQVSSSHVR